MSHALALQDFRLAPQGGALTLTLKAGQMLGVFGPAGSGKSRFVRCVAGLDRSYKGTVRLGAEIALAGYPEPTRRSTPESIARKAAGRNGNARAAEALVATRLRDVGKSTYDSLSPSSQAGAELLEALASPAHLLLADGQFDRMDPWARANAWEHWLRRLGMGGSAVMTTNDPSLAPGCDLVLIWNELRPAFVGTYEELERRHGQAAYEVETMTQRGVRALCEPFTVSVEEAGPGVRVTATAGQALPARLLLEGYGDVRSIVERRPTPEEVFAGLL